MNTNLSGQVWPLSAVTFSLVCISATAQITNVLAPPPEKDQIATALAAEMVLSTNAAIFDPSGLRSNLGASTPSYLSAPLGSAWLVTSTNSLNLNFGQGTQKTGPAAIGQGSGDVWNWVNTAYLDPFDMSGLVWSDGSNSGAFLEVQNGADLWGNGSTDPMYDSYIYPSGGRDINDISVWLGGVPAGTYDFYVYGHGPSNNGNSVFELWVNQTSYGQKGTSIWGAGWNTTNWEGGQQYVLYRSVAIAGGDTLLLNVRPGSAGIAMLNGVQIVPSDAISHDPPPMYRAINVNFGGTPQKMGFAAVGLSTNDTWNWYNDDFYGRTNGALTSLVEADGTATAAGLVVTNAPGYWGMSAGDPMYNTYIYPSGSGHIGLIFTNLSMEGLTADFYLYGHGPSTNGNTVFQLTTAGITNGPRGTTIWGTAWASASWEEGIQYVVFRNVPLSTNQPVFIDAAPGSSGYTLLNGLQIVVPLDRDGNGLPDWWEMLNFGHLGVDPNADQDGDGVSNWYEYLYQTDPNNAFTGGVPDSWTAQWKLTTADPDFDGLPNQQEYLWGSNPSVSEGLAIWVNCPSGFSGIP